MVGDPKLSWRHLDRGPGALITRGRHTDDGQQVEEPLIPALAEVGADSQRPIGVDGLGSDDGEAEVRPRR